MGPGGLAVIGRGGGRLGRILRDTGDLELGGTSGNKGDFELGGTSGDRRHRYILFYFLKIVNT